MAVTRIKNNQVTDASGANTQLGINANTKLQNYSITSGKLANNLVYGSDLTITGNLTVQGNTTAIDTTITTIEDPVITLASTQTSGAPAVDIGFLGFRGNQSNIAFVWDESADEFVTVFTSTSETNTTVTITSYADFHTNNANIGGNIVINGTTSLVGNIVGAVSFTGNITAGNLSTPGAVSAAGNVTGGNLRTAGAVTATGNVTGGNVTTAGLITATGNVTGGNVTTAGLITATGNILGGNLLTAGLISATSTITSAANITGGNVLTGGLVSATGPITSAANVTGGNLVTGGLVTATGNVTGGNVTTAGLITATGNIVGGNLATSGSGGTISGSGNIIGGNILTGGVVSATGNITAGAGSFFIGNGSQLTGVSASSVNANALVGNTLSPNVLFSSLTSVGTLSNLSVTGDTTSGNIYSLGTITATGTIQGSYLYSTGEVSAAGNVVGANVRTAGLISATGTIISASNISGANILTGGLVSATGNITSGNVTTGGLVSATGNITGGNILTGGLVSATGSITSAANVTGGNLVTGGIVSATGNITGGNILTPGQISAAGLATSGNVQTAGFVSATGNINTAGNINLAGNIFDSGSLTITTASGDLNLSPAANINVGNRYINNLQLTPVQDGDAASKYYVDLLASTALAYHEAVVAATTGNLATATGGTITYNQPNGASNGVGATLTTTGSFNLIDTANVQTVGTRILVKNEANAAHNGIYVWSNATVITRSTDADQYGPNDAEQLSINDYFFVSGGNVNLGSAWVVDQPTGVITFGTSNIVFAQFSQAQVYSANTSAGLSLVGQTFSAKVDNNTTAFDGGGNISVKAGANLTTPNIGAATGTSFSATGNIQGGNILTAGFVTATGNLAGGNVTTAGVVTATGTVTGGNLATGGTVSATGTATLGNVATAGTVSATGNVTGGNLLTAGLVSATGSITSASNISGANISTAGLITATGNVTGGNILTAGLISATGNGTFGNISTAGTFSAASLSATGNITGGNIATAGLVTAAGNVTGGNLLTAGLISATGAITSTTTITGGNLATGGTVSATGNVTGGNIATAGLVTATGNVTGGNFLTGGLISATGTITSATTITGGNLATGGTVSATGNVTGGNVLTGGLVSATGTITSAANISGGNLLTGGLISSTGAVTSGGFTTTGNVTGGNILFGSGIVSGTGNVYAANFIGNISGNIDAAGANTQVQFNDTGDILGASAGFTFNKVGNILTANGNITGANLFTGGSVSATANITGANLVLTSGVIDGPASGRITINGSDIDTDFAVDGDTLANVFYVDAGTGTASFGASTQVTNAIVNFAVTNSIKLPVGNTGQRPSTGVTGMVRFNTTNNNLEVYDNSAWAAVGVPSFTVVADQQFNGDGSTVAFTLSSTQTTNSCIVSINGVVQIPTSAYSVAGTNPTCVLTFTEAPAAGDLIDVRQITTTTTVTSISNSSGNAVVGVSDTAALVNVTGDLSVTGSILGGNINSTAITNGNSNVRVVSSGGNVTTSVGGTANVMVVSSTDVTITGNLTVTGNATLTGNILGDRIQNGTTIIDIQNAGGNANITVGGTANVAQFTPTSVIVGANILPTANITYDIGSTTQRFKDIWLANSTIYLGNAQMSANATALILTNPTGGTTVLAGTGGNITGGNITTGGLVSATGNVTGGNILTAGIMSSTGNGIHGNVLTAGVVSATGNITGNFILGNGSQLTGIDATSIQSGTSNVRVVSSGGNVTTGVGGTANVVVVATTGQFVTGVISASGSITTGGDLSLTGNIVDAAALTISTGSNGNITLAPNGTGVIVVNTDIRNGQANATGNIGATSARFNTVFALATSAQYADLAEKYTADATYEPGTVVMFGGSAEVTLCVNDGCSRVAGVISTNPSYRMNDGLVSEHTAMVALTGRVPTRVTGTVRKGDLMVSAGNGTARAEANPRVGTVIGKALADSEGDAVIEVVVGRV